MPAVSVVLPVFNGMPYLREAVDSILGQTFRDFELLAIDDGSTDGTAALLASYTDPRLRVLTNDCNRGLVYSLNRGLDAAQGEYIARMDADDISLPVRLETQVQFLERYTSVGVVGSWYETFGVATKVVRPYVDSDRLNAALLFNSCLAHPTVLLRASVVRETAAQYLSEEFPIEDWGLWVRLSRCVNFANVPVLLLRYRVHGASITGTQGGQHGEQSRTARASSPLYRKLLAALGLHPTDEELDTHTAIGFGFPLTGCEALARGESWLRKLLVANRRRRVYSEPAFSDVVGSKWSAVNFGRPAPLPEKVSRWVRSPLFRHAIRGAITNRLSRAQRGYDPAGFGCYPLLPSRSPPGTGH